LAITGGLGSGRVEETYGTAALQVVTGQITRLSEIRRLSSQFVPTDEQFGEAFATATVRNRRQARYILSRLENQLRVDRKEGELAVVSDESKVNLEHIMPQAGGPDWPGSPDEQRFYVDRLGNLALLLTTENRNLGNESFSVKKNVYASSQLLLTNELATRPVWDFDEIGARQRAMAGIAIRAWPL
jgi:hypothetical protein